MRSVSRTRSRRSGCSGNNAQHSVGGFECRERCVPMIPGVAHRRQFKNLSEQEILALAISSEEDDGRIYRWYAQRLRADYPQSARLFDEMASEEDEHVSPLIEEHRRRFGEAIPLIRREHVAGFYHRRPVWLIENLG